MRRCVAHDWVLVAGAGNPPGVAMVLPSLAPGPSCAVTSSRIHQASEGRHCPGCIRPRVCSELAEGLWARPGILKGTWVGWGGGELKGTWVGGAPGCYWSPHVGHTAARLGNFRAERLGLLHISLSYAAMNESSSYKLACLCRGEWPSEAPAHRPRQAAGSRWRPWGRCSGPAAAQSWGRGGCPPPPRTPGAFARRLPTAPASCSLARHGCSRSGPLGPLSRGRDACGARGPV